MFKTVEYVSFDSRPDLRGMAVRATSVLAQFIQSWRDELLVTWRPGLSGSEAGLELTLSLALWNATGTASGFIRSRDFEPGEEGWLRSDLLDVWLDLLGMLSRQQMNRLDEMVREPAEA